MFLLKKYRGGALILACCMFVAIFKYRKGEINYLNSDATFHTLLTVQAYSKTPFRVHKFLPLVSLGNPEDKSIPWGACIPDKYGNYYYTSFSPATYVLPFVFFNSFHLPVNEASLYLLNSMLYALSAFFWFLLLQKIFHKNTFISFWGTIIYSFSPELFHGMGVVYWSQSIFQVVFIFQLLFYYNWRFEKSKKYRLCFLVLCLLCPYIEWSGFIANGGFAIAELARFWRNDKKRACLSFCIIGFLTCTSFLLFCFHYLLNVNPRLFFSAIKSRFFARTITTSVPISSLIAGYYESFNWIWLVVFVLICVNVFLGAIIIKKRTLLFLTLFPCLENFLVIQHAVSYTYDRMKLSFFISLLTCLLLENIFLNYKKTQKTKALLSFLIFLCAVANVKSYKNNPNYIWSTDYREANKCFANYINEKYSDSILGLQDYSVRGYANMLFGRGIYEWRSIENLLEIAKQNKKRFVVLLHSTGGSWSLYQFTFAEIYDVETGEKYIYLAPVHCSSLSDSNWNKGILKSNNRTILFKNNTELLNVIKDSNCIESSDTKYQIINIDYDSTWIRITVDKDASACAYPTNLSFSNIKNDNDIDSLFENAEDVE